jgi:hypothetical protein
MDSANSKDARSQGQARRRWLFLLLSSAAFVLIAVFDALVSTKGRASALSWSGWMRFSACWFLFFWFAVFVWTSAERGWFRGWSRIVHALGFSAWLTLSALLVYVPAHALPIIFLVGLPVGYFAEYWLHGL